MECPALDEATERVQHDLGGPRNSIGSTWQGVLTVTWDVHTSTPGAEVPARIMA